MEERIIGSVFISRNEFDDMSKSDFVNIDFDNVDMGDYDKKEAVCIRASQSLNIMWHGDIDEHLSGILHEVTHAIFYISPLRRTSRRFVLLYSVKSENMDYCLVCRAYDPTDFSLAILAI